MDKGYFINLTYHYSVNKHLAKAFLYPKYTYLDIQLVGIIPFSVIFYRYIINIATINIIIFYIMVSHIISKLKLCSARYNLILQALIVICRM